MVCYEEMCEVVFYNQLVCGSRCIATHRKGYMKFVKSVTEVQEVRWTNPYHYGNLLTLI